jgi:hypothetical protein
LLNYVCIITIAAIGYFGGTPWSILVGGLGLALTSLAQQQRLRPRFAAVGATDVLALAGLASFANACLAAGGAYILGRVVGWLLPL